MSNAAERERAVAALAGQSLPKVGEVGWLDYAESPCVHMVRVERTSRSGKTLWLTFKDTGDPVLLNKKPLAWRRLHATSRFWRPRSRVVATVAFPQDAR